ncbi:right-handed parallel beta-helix repeat-containing protein [Candidatus Daviesbacteria bacterium]|nr:right-handed parallel beta-helix repeat-containing protein [Candidatus Daviesbacteria bacterium]
MAPLKLFIFSIALAFVVIFSISQFMAKGAQSLGNTFYVSKTGNNSDGRSWNSAWNELNQINWSLVSPGDIILIDGGQSQMVYTSTLTLGKSGTSASPITIKLSDEAGRSGKAVIFGGRSQPLGYCRQTNYVYQTSGVRDRGIQTGASSWVIIDGLKWAGIAIYGHNGNGIKLNSSSSNITVRNVEVYDNGTWNSSEPDQPGIGLSGTNNTVERSIIHDNGQDAFQSGGGVSNFTLRQSWLYNERKNPSGVIWNNCTHSDGIQIYAGFEQSGLTIEDSIIGPGFMQGVLLGQSAYTDSTGTTRWAVLHDVTIRNSLWYGSTNCNICDYANTQVKPRNWRIENVISDRATDDTWHNIQFNGDPSQLTISNSIFYGGMNASVPAGGIYTGNIQYNLSGTRVGMIVDPMYINTGAHGSSSTSADFTLASSSPAKGKGSTITSSSSLLSQSIVVQPLLTSTTSPTVSPTPSSTSTPTLTPNPTNQTAQKFTQRHSWKNANIMTILRQLLFRSRSG